MSLQTHWPVVVLSHSPWSYWDSQSSGQLGVLHSGPCQPVSGVQAHSPSVQVPWPEHFPSPGQVFWVSQRSPSHPLLQGQYGSQWLPAQPGGQSLSFLRERRITAARMPTTKITKSPHHKIFRPVSFIILLFYLSNKFYFGGRREKFTPTKCKGSRSRDAILPSHFERL